MTIRVDHLSHAPDSSPEYSEWSLPERISDAVLASPDPSRAFTYFTELQTRSLELLNDLSDRPEVLRRLALVFSLSRFLADECLRHAEWLRQFADMDLVLTALDYTKRLDEYLPGPAPANALDLALFRRKELLRVVARDGSGSAGLADITSELSSLADAILGRALATVTAELQRRYGVPVAGDLPVAFSVIALGKLGGRELNYSSDVDLMFLYAENGETSGPQKISNKEFFKKVANQFTSLLSTYTSAGTCYRIDLRLRPEGSLGEVAISLQGAKDYYSRRARDWELQMLIKARVAAGDVFLGQELLDFVEPAIYSTTLDFTTIETMSVTRERISEKLARKRLKQPQLDVKLARGGIRDIEFLVQCLQRLHGAYDSSVRHGGTLFALSSLLAKDMLSESEHARLAQAYEFLRYLEHRVQVEDDRQTHALPSDPADLERIARRMLPAWSPPSARLGSGVQLLQALNQNLENVQVIYDRIVHAQRPLSYSPSPVAPVPFRGQDEPSPARSPSELSSEILTAIGAELPNFALLLQTRGFQRSECVLSAFAESVSKEPYSAHLIETQPASAAYVLQLLELSPFLTEQIRKWPDLLDEIRKIAEHPSIRPAFEGLSAPLSDMDGLRRFFRREIFRILAGSVCLPEPVFPTLDRMSGLAEFLIARAYRIALELGLAHARAHATSGKPFSDPQDQMMVVALGRLGMREFDLGSDADMVFIIPDTELPRQQFWTRVAEHMIEILTAYSGDGPILSLDTRLRPNGRAGVLVQSESNYTEYFARHAEAWEGIAYMKARGVAGDLERATHFLTELQQVDWRRYGQSGRSRQDLRQMRLRLQREQSTLAPLKAAEGGYYDADFILMYLRLRGAGMFFKSLNTPERIDIVEKMGHLERADAEFLLDATTYFRAVDHALRIVTGRSEQRLPNSPPERHMVATLVQRWTQRETSSETLDDRLLSLRHQMRRLFDSIFQ